MKQGNTSQNISSIDNFGYWDISLVGGKAYSLSNLFRGGFNVPKAICINTIAYKTYLNRDNSLIILINQLLGGKQQNEEIGTQLKDKFLAINFDYDFTNEILNEIKRLGNIDTDYFAVRSSATTEDLIEASFAGQHDTFLNVQGKIELILAIKKCWLSLWSTRAIIYREQKGINHSNAQMGVVIQKMILADKSGVTFSINPINGNTNQILINVVTGEGEKLVSGFATPCEFIINKTSNNLISSKVKSNQNCKLNTTEIKLLTEISKNIEFYFATPQDIEWSISNNQIFILQSRPITEFKKILNIKGVRGSWTRIGFDDWLRKPMSPLFESLVIPELNNVADAFIASKIKLYRNKPTWNSIDGFFYTKISFKYTLKAFLIPYLFIKLIKNIHTEWSNEFVSQHERRIDKLIRQETKTISEIKEHLQEVINANADAWSYIILTGICAKLSEIFFSLLFKIFVPTKYSFSYTEVLSGYFNKSIEADEAIWQVALNAKVNKKLFDYILLEGNCFNEISKLDEAWLQELKIWINKYGSRLFELDFIFPSMQDEPEMVLDIVRNYLKSNTTRSPYTIYYENYIKSKKIKFIFLNEICKKNIFGKLLLSAFNLAEKYATIRENRPFYLHYGWWLMRKDVIKIAKLAKDKKMLFNKNDIFFISKTQFEQILNSMETDNSLSVSELHLMSEIIHINKSIYEKRTKITTIPKTLSSNFIISRFLKFLSYGRKSKNNNIFSGYSGSSGISKGIICKIEGTSDFFKFKQDQILLALYTTPAWTPLFSMAGGIVTQHGGSLSHAAIVAREYQIPAVLGIDNIFQLLNDGDEVELNGNNGTLTLIQRNSVYEQ